MKHFKVKAELDGDDAYIAFGNIRNGEVTGNFMVEDDRIDGYVVLDLDANNRLVGIEIIGVKTVVRNGANGLQGKVPKQRRPKQPS